MAKQRDYWVQRAIIREANAHERMQAAQADLEDSYRRAAKALDAKIDRFYARYADEYGVTLDVARKHLTYRENADWLRDVKRMMRDIRNKAPGWEVLQQSLDAMSFAARISRIDARKVEIGLILDELAIESRDIIGGAMAEIVTSGYYGLIYDAQIGAGRAFPVLQVDDALIRQVNSYPWSGATYSDRIWRNREALGFQLRETLTQGLIRGESVDTMSRELHKKMDSSRTAAQRIVQTECAYAHNTAILESYDTLDIDEYRFIATFDERTCEICGALDGERFAVADAVIGENAPVMHPRCRCVTIPDGDLTGERIARGHDGKNYKVDAGLSYREWRRMYVTDADGAARSSKRRRRATRKEGGA